MKPAPPVTRVRIRRGSLDSRHGARRRAAAAARLVVSARARRHRQRPGQRAARADRLGGRRARRPGPRRPRLTLERPPKVELGDYSTNAAMLLAPSLGGPPREIAEQLRTTLAGTLGEGAERVEVAGPGFVNLFLADRWYREATRGIVVAGDRFGAGDASRPRADPGRVRERQPDRPDHRRGGARRQLRGLARAHPRVARPRGRARVLRQRRRHPGRELRRLDRRPDAGRGARRGRVHRRVRRRARRASCAAQGLAPDDLETLQVAGIEAMRSADRGDARALPRPLRHLVLGARAARGRRPRGGRRRAARARARLRERGRDLVPDDDVRRRQGPRPDPERRRADLLRDRHRLPPRQALARLRPPDRRRSAATTTATWRG